jgi:phytoene synthase
MDISVTRYQTFEDLYRYCYHVASAVGLVCIHIFGFTEGENARRYAELCGVAFQLTNILRDIEEDEKIGRIYIPQEDLDRFACPEEHIRNRVYNEPFRNLMVFQVDRAHTFYRDALPLLPLIDPASRGCLAAMIRIYWQNLHEIERRNYNVFGGKIRLPVWKKLAIAAQAMIRKRV